VGNCTMGVVLQGLCVHLEVRQPSSQLVVIQANLPSPVPHTCVESIPLDNSTQIYEEVEEYGRPMAPPDVTADAAAADSIPVTTFCTNANFSGNCITWVLSCDFCVPLDGIWKNSISSIQMLDTRVGCNFYVSVAQPSDI
jgi:hypothetical protein